MSEERIEKDYIEQCGERFKKIAKEIYESDNPHFSIHFMLADIMHYCRDEFLSFEDEMKKARDLYAEETMRLLRILRGLEAD